MRVGIVGCGVIGTELAQAIDREIEDAQLVTLTDIDEKKAKELADSLEEKPKILLLDELIKESDLIIEAASKDVVSSLARKVIEQGKDIMIMSVGGLLGNEDILDLARKKDCKIYLPSGALAGLDGVKSASIGRIDSVTLTTRKPPEGLRGAPYIIRKKIDLDAINKETVIFEGTAAEAVKGFPKNINVSAALSLAGIGAEKTRVKIIVDPGIKRNIHEIEVKGEFGRLVSRTENLPSPKNPKTSYLACLSAIATLKGIVSSIKVGT
jgi:aspartate dehydrogenase